MNENSISTNEVTTYAVENVTLTDNEDSADLFLLELVEDSDREIDLPELTNVIKVNVL